MTFDGTTAARRVPCELYFWPDPRSYTRQPAAELHLAGSAPLAGAACRALCAAGARLAQPGEFTLRAFLAGRLDLTQAEAVLGVIDANTAGGLQAALAQLAGGISRPLAALRERLVNLLAHLEVGLDFVEEDIEFISAAELAAQLAEIADGVDEITRQLAARVELQGAPQVVLLGRPNAGKSTLFKALVEQDRALVSPRAGTTRDYLTAVVEWNGLRCELVDTAGLDDRQGEVIDSSAELGIEQEAQQKSRAQAAAAAIRLWCVATGESAAEMPESFGEGAILVRTKTDLAEHQSTSPGEKSLAVSSLTGAGLAELKAAIGDELWRRQAAETDGPAATAVRCRASLRQAGAEIAAARILVAERAGEELVAAALREVLRHLGEVVGTVYTDDILDRVFGRFCIGK